MECSHEFVGVIDSTECFEQPNERLILDQKIFYDKFSRNLHLAIKV